MHGIQWGHTWWWLMMMWFLGSCSGLFGADKAASGKESQRQCRWSGCKAKCICQRRCRRWTRFRSAWWVDQVPRLKQLQFTKTNLIAGIRKEVLIELSSISIREFNFCQGLKLFCWIFLKLSFVNLFKPSAKCALKQNKLNVKEKNGETLQQHKSSIGYLEWSY